MIEYITGIVLLLFVNYLSQLFLVKKVDNGPVMKIEALYVYPVKGLRPFALSSATIGLHGFQYDRTFSLQKVHRDPDTKEVIRLEAILIGYELAMALFGTHLDISPSHPEDANVVVTWIPPSSEEPQSLAWTGSPDQIRFPVKPSVDSLKEVDVSLHGSTTKAYDMGSDISTWFSERFGYEVILVNLGSHSRAVLGSLAPSSPLALQKSLSAKIYSLLPSLAPKAERLSFNDLGQYLIVTRSSTDELSSRLSDGSKMDVSKFRPNVVLSGSSAAFDEDFWSELTFTSSDKEGKKVKMQLTANCYRCQSITVDYRTGKQATGDSGLVWKKLVKDRRVDKGAKWSPVFGRYGFCSDLDKDVVLRVGDGVVITGRNEERTTFDWPGLTTFGVTK